MKRVRRRAAEPIAVTRRRPRFVLPSPRESSGTPGTEVEDGHAQPYSTRPCQRRHHASSTCRRRSPARAYSRLCVSAQRGRREAASVTACSAAASERAIQSCDASEAISPTATSGKRRFTSATGRRQRPVDRQRPEQDHRAHQDQVIPVRNSRRRGGRYLRNGHGAPAHDDDQGQDGGYDRRLVLSGGSQLADGGSQIGTRGLKVPVLRAD